MKVLTLASIIFLSFSRLFPGDNIVEPQGKYNDIDVQRSNEIIQILNNNNYDFFGRKYKAAKRVYEDPGSYNPPALLAAGIYFLTHKNYDKAALLCAGAMVRCEIDILISQDNSVRDTLSIFSWELSAVLEQCSFSENENRQWELAFKEAVENIETWHRKTPRNYDERWIRLHSIRCFTNSDFVEISEDQKQKLIDEYFLWEKTGEKEEDYDNISEESEYSFDFRSRIFTHDQSKVSFYLPETFRTEIDLFDKTLLPIFKYSEIKIYLSCSWFLHPSSIEEQYKSACEHKDSCEEILLIKIGNSIPAYHIRYIDECQVSNSFSFQSGQYFFEFSATCDLEKEQELLKDLQIVLNSVRLKS